MIEYDYVYTIVEWFLGNIFKKHVLFLAFHDDGDLDKEIHDNYN